MKASIHDTGDPSVGIFSQVWYVDVPFERSEVDTQTLEFFRTTIESLYKEFANGKIYVEFDFETAAQHEYEQSLTIQHITTMKKYKSIVYERANPSNRKEFIFEELTTTDYGYNSLKKLYDQMNIDTPQFIHLVEWIETSEAA